MVRRIKIAFAWMIVTIISIGLILVLLSVILTNPMFLLWAVGGIALLLALVWAWTILEQDSYR